MLLARGKIHIITGTVLRNIEADEIFKQYQERANMGELPFRRYPLKSVRAIFAQSPYPLTFVTWIDSINVNLAFRSFF
jgi:hypothetical protein